MNLTEQTVSGTNEVYLQDSLNASLLKLKVMMGTNTTVPEGNDCFIYVDKTSQETPTEERKEYLFELAAPLRHCNSVGDELLQEIKIINNEPVMKTIVNRKVGVTEEGTNYVLDNPVIEEIDAFPVTLFEGTNYIYTNYNNANIELIYPKDTEANRTFLNNAMYHNHKLKNDGEFSLEDIYFKDAFTKSEDKLNLEVNNANIDCITSRNNKFSLDSEGNLIVNSITTALSTDPSINNENICNLIYPVGSIYMSTNNINPSTLFGGTWEQIKGRFLLGQGINEANTTNYWGAYNANTCNFPNGEMGGEPYHTLTINEMPSHAHNVGCPNKWDWGTGGDRMLIGSNGGYTLGTLNGFYQGGNSGHNNIPPYFVVYIWKRVS